MSSSLRVNTIVPSTGTNVAIGTANGTVTFTDSVNFVLGTGSSIFSPASNTLTFGTNDAERLRITSGGSVAIGVNSPSDILHVGGNNAFIRVDRPNGNPGLTLIYNSTNSTRGDIDVTTGGDLRFATNGSTERLRITSGGQVIIGDSASDLSGTHTFMACGSNHAFQHDGNTGTYLSIGLGAANGTVDLEADARSGGYPDMRFITTNTERLRITSGGVIQCGTSATLKAEINNSVSGHQFISQCSDNNNGFEVYQQHASNTTRNTFAVYANTGSGNAKNLQFAVRGDGEALISNNVNRFLSLDRTNASSGSGEFNVNVESNSQTTVSYDDGSQIVIGTSSSPRSQAGFTERVRISSAGDATFKHKVNIGDSHAGGEILSLGKSSGTSYMSFHTGGANMGFIGYANQLIAGGGSSQLGIRSQDEIRFATGGNTERMRLSVNGEHMVYSNGTVSALRTAAASSGSAEILYCTRNSSSVTVGTGVYAIYSNGSASSLSDRTQKKNIETTRDGYLEDLNRLRVVKYNWNDQEDGTPKELGLIAQEVEEVFPGLISDMRSDVGIGTTASTKGVKTSVLPYMLLKALQEANAEIVALKARVNTLEGS